MQLAEKRERNVGIKGVWVTLGRGPAVAAGRSSHGECSELPQGWQGGPSQPEVMNQMMGGTGKEVRH